MEDFDAWKEIWQRPVKPVLSLGEILKNAKTNKNALLKSRLIGAVTLFVTSILIGYAALSKMFDFESELTYWGMGVAAIVPLLQGIFLLLLYKKLHALHITDTPSAHLKQWEEYYEFNKRVTKINGPLYFVLLNIGMGMYSLELLSRMSLSMKCWVIGVYVAWMLFAYFYLGKKTIKKESDRMAEIINSLKIVEGQLQ
jgi:hypothetical protein